MPSDHHATDRPAGRAPSPWGERGRQGLARASGPACRPRGTSPGGGRLGESRCGSVELGLLLPWAVAGLLLLGGWRTLDLLRHTPLTALAFAPAPALESPRSPRASDAGEPGLPALVAELPFGAPARGRELFRTKHGCALCHGDPAVPGSQIRGPDLSAIGARGAERVPGLSAAQYVYDSIRDPDAYHAEAPVAPDGTLLETMPVPTLTEQEAADLVAYLLQVSSLDLERQPSTTNATPSAD